eukprot:UN25238
MKHKIRRDNAQMVMLYLKRNAKNQLDSARRIVEVVIIPYQRHADVPRTKMEADIIIRSLEAVISPKKPNK